MDPEAASPTTAHKVDVNAYHMAYRDNGSVNARCIFYCYNPPIVGKRITVLAWIADKYARRGKNYIVTQAVSVDQDGCLLDRVITHELKQPAEVGKTGPSQFTDTETARDTLGTSGTVASGRMSLTFATELLRRYFGAEFYNRGGMVELRFLRSVRPGDTVTFSGKVTGITKVTDGGRVNVEVIATNQKGDVTAVGEGACVVPSSCVPADT